MKKAKVYFLDRLAGRLQQDENGYFFIYDSDYLKQKDAVAVSLTLPLTDKPYISKGLHPFFAHLIPEGWLFDLNAQTLKIDNNDEFSMLLATGRDCIGAVSVVPDEEVL